MLWVQKGKNLLIFLPLMSGLGWRLKIKFKNVIAGVSTNVWINYMSAVVPEHRLSSCPLPSVFPDIVCWTESRVWPFWPRYEYHENWSMWRAHTSRQVVPGHAERVSSLEQTKMYLFCCANLPICGSGSLAPHILNLILGWKVIGELDAVVKW